MTDTVVYQRAGFIGRLTLNNPEKHNALGRKEIDVLRARLAAIEAEKEIRVLVLTGAGDKTFCAGAALNELSDGAMADDAFQLMSTELASLSVPTICALNGNVFGGGVELALSCDFRTGVEGSRMRVPAAALGLCYPLAGLQRYVDTVGVQLAKRILIGAEVFPAESMLQIGFLDHLVPRAQLQQVTEQQAEQIAGLAPLAVQAMKQLLQRATGARVDAQDAARLSQVCLASDDLAEGFAAQREGRSPEFQGK